VPIENASLRGVTVGPDGNLWYTANMANRIGCMSPAGEPLLDIAIPTPASGARCIATMSNGRLYFTEYDASSIGEVIFE
jgi:virginiamycin B lyase